MGESGSRRGIDVVVVDSSLCESVDSSTVDVVVDESSGSVDVVVAVVMVEPGTNSGRWFDAHPTATDAGMMTSARSRKARVMARDPIDRSERAVVGCHR